MPTPLEELSDWAVRTQTIPEDVRAAARRVLMDQVGVSLGGAHRLETHVRGEPSAALWSTGERVYAPDAALANRFAGDDLELNAGPEIGAAGIAAADVADATLGELYIAMAVASEIESYVRGWFQRSVEDHGLHPPAVFGALSAAAVSAKVIRLDAETFTGALAAALALAPQSHYASFSHGATGKWLYGAWSQRLGVQAALWAQMGITGASTTLDGARGIAQAFLHGASDPPSFQPEGWALTEVTFKAFPCSRACHPALTALEKIGSMDPSAIVHIDIWSYPFSVELEERSTHASSIADQMSISAMVRQRLRTDAPICVHAEGSDGLPRKREARVRVTLDDGSVREAASEAKWSARHPATDEELRDRFLTMTRDKKTLDPWNADDSVRVRELVDVAELRLEGLTKRFGDHTAVERFDLSVQDGELMTLLGPSGSGKSTVLRLVAGYIHPDSGAIHIEGRDVTSLPPEERDIGMVFQSYALFPHRSVFRNVAFGLERRRAPKEEIRSRVAETLALVRLEGLDARLPKELSGGQQQRVALARALVIRPTLLLLDEPLSNLDAQLRAELRLEIRRIQKALGITTVLVTHDQEEALTVSDRVAVIREGQLQQLATPDELYRKPGNRFVAEFVGKMNLLPATRDGERVYRLETGETIHTAAASGEANAILAVRPEVVRAGMDKDWNQLKGTVAHRVFLGELTEIGVTLADGTLFLARGSDLPSVAPGESLTLSWPADATALLDP